MTEEIKADSAQLAEIGEKIVKRGRGRPKGSSSPRPDSSYESGDTHPGDNRKFIENALVLWDLPKCDMSDPVAVQDRIEFYFKTCAERDVKPSLVGMAFALGVDRTYIWKLREGERGKNVEVVHILKKASSFLELLLNDYGQNGKINPAALIFMLKNHFGYADKQEIVLSPQSPLGDSPDRKALEDRYVDAVVDVDPADSD